MTGPPKGAAPPGGPEDGVPEALPRTVLRTGRTLGAAAIDRLWLFPPLVQGRREWGLVVAACYRGESSRRLVSARYAAARNGRGLFLEVEVREEGVMPPDRVARVMEGVARRGPEPLGAPSAVEVGAPRRPSGRCLAPTLAASSRRILRGRRSRSSYRRGRVVDRLWPSLSLVSYG